MKKGNKKPMVLLISAALVLLMSAGSYADSSITGFTNYDVAGKDMAGMEVTFSWTLNGVAHQETVQWVAGTGNKGFAQVPDGSGNYLFRVRVDNKTYDNPWNVDIANKTGLVLKEFSLDGFNGGIVFDLTSPGDTNKPSQEDAKVPKGTTGAQFYGTAGSDRGIIFKQGGGPNLQTTVTYSNPVHLDGQAAVGDLYQKLDVVFNTGYAYTGPSQYAFYADTDKVTFLPETPSDPLGAATPLPGAVLLLGAGMARLVAYTRRRQA